VIGLSLRSISLRDCVLGCKVGWKYPPLLERVIEEDY